MKTFSTNKRIPASRLMLIWLIASILFGQLTMAQVTYTTEVVPAANLSLGVNYHTVYALKVVVGPDGPFSINTLSFKTSGNYRSSDIFSFYVLRNVSSPSQAGGIQMGQQASTSTGAGETFTFTSFVMPLPASSTTYFLVTVLLREGATRGRTIKIDGASNPVNITYKNIPPPTIINSQTDAAGTQTIDSPLPVTLVSFSAKTEGPLRQIHWETTMEKDNDYFAVQRSSDAKSFTEIARLKGTAEGYQTHRYNYSDAETVPAGAVLYYRLKMVDFDGTYAYSAIASCRDGNLQTLQATVFPNPFSEYVKVKYKAGESVSFTLVSQDGRWLNIPEKRVVPASGESILPDLDKLIPGVYFLTISSSAGTVTKKIVKE
jgi:hypothetical protein